MYLSYYNVQQNVVFKTSAYNTYIIHRYTLRVNFPFVLIILAFLADTYARLEK